jgi:hypothetical protein
MQEVSGLTRRNVLIGGALAGLAGVAGPIFTAASPAYAGPWGGYSNGYIPSSALAQVPWNPALYLRLDARDALVALNNAFYQTFNKNLPLNDAYRNFDKQVAARADWCARGECQNAADPGTSNHGWALAIDVGGVGQFAWGNATYVWLKANAPSYGWVHPSWAEPNGSTPEAWHWEYNGSYSGPTTPVGPIQRTVMEISVSNGMWVAQSVGHSMITNQFSVVDMGKSNGDIFASEGGTLRHLEPTTSGWQKHDSGFPLNATSLSAVNVGQAWPQILAIENNRLFHVYADATGWHKGDTQITVGSGARVSAVLLPGNSMQAAISDGGRLYHVTTSNGWQKWDTSAPCGPDLKATYHSGSHPTVSTVMNGQVYQIYGAPGQWSAQSTGKQASGPMTAVNQGGGYPTVFANEGWNIVQTSVGAAGWERNGMYPNIVVVDRIDGIARPGYPILYAG